MFLLGTIVRYNRVSRLVPTNKKFRLRMIPFFSTSLKRILDEPNPELYSNELFEITNFCWFPGVSLYRGCTVFCFFILKVDETLVKPNWLLFLCTRFRGIKRFIAL